MYVQMYLEEIYQLNGAHKNVKRQKVDLTKRRQRHNSKVLYGESFYKFMTVWYTKKCKLM
jgi:hypothetical protein